MTDFTFEFFKSKDLKSAPTYFKTVNLRFSTQLVFNAGRAFHFERFSPRFSLLVHAGGGFSSLRDARTNWYKSWKENTADEKLNVIVGLTPQFKLTEKIELHGDITFVSHYHQDVDFNFGPWYLNPKVFQGNLINFNIGGMYYIGKHRKHVDWYYQNKKVIEPKDSIVLPPTDSLIVVDYDKDDDGVLDSLDICPEEFGLADFEGCPKPEITFDCDLDLFPVFTFKGARYEILPSYFPVIDSIVHCMLENPGKKMIVYGHADNFGDSIYTQELSYNRADAIKRAIVLKGIDPDRIFVIGEGTKKAKISAEEYSKINHNRVAYFETISNNKYDIKVLESGEFLQGMFYTIQIGAYKKVINNNKFNKFGKVLIANTPEGFVKYSIGTYRNYENAYTRLKELKSNGLFQDAFIAVYFLGERISLKEAQEMLLEKGSYILDKSVE